MDPGSRDYAYRTRHPQIADIVFRRVLDTQSKQVAQYKRVIAAMNTTYSSDNDALKRMIGSKSLRELTNGLEDRRAILGVAEDITGGDVFVLQQQAILEMNHSRGDLELARERLSRAEAARPNDRALKHSRASLLAREAFQEKDELNRRSLRSEARGLLRSLRGDEFEDPYVCALMARLALDDLTDRMRSCSPGGATIADAQILRSIEDAERTLAKGLARSPDFEALIKEKFRLKRILGSKASGLVMLEKTLADQPHLEFVAATYARALGRDDREKGFAALRNCLREKPQSKVINQAIFELMLEDGDDFRDELASPLQKSFTPEDESVLLHIHAIRYRFMRHEREEFASAITNAERMKVPGREKQLPRLPVQNAGSPDGRFIGTVRDIRAVFGFIEIPGMIVDAYFRPLDCRDENVWDNLQKGRRVSLELRFNAKGPVAVDVMTA